MWADCRQDQLVIFLMIVIDQDIAPGRNLCQLSGNAALGGAFLLATDRREKSLVKELVMFILV